MTPRGAGRVLVIARNLPPLRGGIERLMAHTVAELLPEWDCDVIGPAGCAAHLAGANVVAALPAGYVGFLAGALARVLVAPRRGYRLCVASSGLMAPLARLAAWKNRCPYMVWVHGLDLTYRATAYRAAFLPAIRAADHVVANSSHTAELALAAGVARERLSVIFPGVEVAAPAPDDAVQRLAARFGLAGHPLLLFVGRLVERKGVVEFVAQALPRVRAACPEARLLVVGAEPGLGALASGPYRERILAAARTAGVEQAVVLAGELSDDEARAAYAAADVLVFPALARPGDVEGFGMVIVEAAAQGTPSVAFALGGIPDALSPHNGTLVAPGDYAAIADAAIGALQGRLPDSAQCRAHAQVYRWERYGTRVRALCRSVMRAAA